MGEEKKPITLVELANEFADGAASAENPAIRALCARNLILTRYIIRLERIVASLVRPEKAAEPAKPAEEHAPDVSEEDATAKMVAEVQAETAAEAAAVAAKANGQKAEAQS